MSELSQITALAKRQIALSYKVAELEEALKIAKSEFQKVSEVDLPEAMDKVGMTEFTLEDGRTIEIASQYYATISEEHAEEAFRWLEENDHGAIIKNDIVISFGRGEDEDAQSLFDALRETYPENNLMGKRGVHPQTLKAWVRKQLESGEDFPQEVFGVFERRVAKIGAVRR